MTRAERLALPTNQPLSMPIYLSAAWEFDGPAQLDGINDGTIAGVYYGTYGAPNQRALESVIRAHEGAEASLVTASGMSAIFATFLTLLRPSARIVAADDLFGQTTRLLKWLVDWGVRVTTVDATRLDTVHEALQGDCDVLYVETISNPLLRVVDLEALATAAHQHNAKLVVDNTFASPLLCRPIETGADVSIESLTKHLSGHHDVVLGSISGAVSLIDEVRPRVINFGVVASPFDCWLALRGLETAGLRVACAVENARALAPVLADHPAVRTVHYPGLMTHPDASVARRVLSDPGTMISIELRDPTAVKDLLARLEVVRYASSLGGVHSTLLQPSRTTHRALDTAEQARLGIDEGFLRLSVGVEPIEDLVADLTGALDAALAARHAPVQAGSRSL